MKKALFLTLAIVLTMPLSVIPTSLASTGAITRIDVLTNQDSSYTQPDQIAVERSLDAGTLQPERLRMTPVPAVTPYGMTAFSNDPKDVYMTDRHDGSIWEMNVDSGQVLAHFSPSKKPSNNIEGIAADDEDHLYVYYNGEGTIQRLSRTGTVEASFPAPTIYGHSLAYRDGSLDLLDDLGEVYEINPSTGQAMGKVTLLQPNGSPLGENGALTLMWDGKYWNVAAIQDHWKLYRYDSGWHFVDKVDLQQWNTTGCVYDGQEYLALNNDDDRVFTIRLVDDTSGDVSQLVTDHYQYIGNVLTTTHAAASFPNYPDKNMMLVYNGQESITTDGLMPYVAYLDANGEPQGDLFDTFLFLPDKELGDQMFYQVTDPTDWAAYIQKSVQDMGTLDQAWAAKNQKLGESNRAKVYLAVPDPNPSDDLATREKAMHLYVDEAIQAIQQAKMSHVQFEGFYWYNEEANYNEPIVVDFNQYVHHLGYRTSWIPDQTATEATDYTALGFDEVFQQPNQYFQDLNTPNINRFFNLAWTGARYRKGVELELDNRVATDASYRALFQGYLHYGLIEGFLGGSKAWYDDGAIGTLYQSGDPLYQTIHEVVTGTYHEDDVHVVAPSEGIVKSTLTTSIPDTAKVRFTVIANKPYDIKKVIIHTNDAGVPMTYMGTIRVDEEVAVKDGQLVKQTIGQASDGMRIGFTAPIDQPIQISIVPEGATPFIDVASTDPAWSAISALSDQGIINGWMHDGQLMFSPNGDITRAQFATMLAEAYHLTGKNPSPFTDANDNWYTPYVDAVYEKGLMNGYDAAHFGPNDPVTQEQVATTLVRIANNEGKSVSGEGATIQNEQSIHSWALQAVLEGEKLGLYGDTFGHSSFNPQAQAERADVAQVLYNALQLD